MAAQFKGLTHQCPNIKDFTLALAVGSLPDYGHVPNPLLNGP